MLNVLELFGRVLLRDLAVSCNSNQKGLKMMVEGETPQADVSESYGLT